MANNLFPVINTNNRHTPSVAGDKLDPSLSQISAREGNTLQILPDGLYAGIGIGANTIYVAASGNDVNTAGARATPYKTLDYALAQLTERSRGRFTGTMNVALRAGEQFTMGADFLNFGELVLTFYDSNYGDFDGPLIGTGADPAVMADLNRPVINVQGFQANAQWQSAGIRNGKNAHVVLAGIRVNLALRPPSQPQITLYGGLSDFITFTNRSDAFVNLRGAVLNQSSTSYFGFLGIHARNGVGTLSQFASQLLVDGLRLGDEVTAPTAQQLLYRQYHIKFYVDAAGNNQTFIPLSATATNSSSGSGLLALEWSESQALPVIGASFSMASYPTLFDAAFGMRNYFFGLQRDQQQRPMNVLSSRLF